jgi:hypothetical protein
MSPIDEQRLQAIFRREYRSLLQYVREAAPFASGPDRLPRDAVLRIATEEAAALEAFGEVLDGLRIPLPYLGSFPVVFTDLNFVTIRHLLPKLIVEQKNDLVKLEADVPLVLNAIAYAAVLRLIDLHRRHLQELESLG